MMQSLCGHTAIEDRKVLPCSITLVTLRCELISRPRLALWPLGAPFNMNLGSTIGLVSVCQPFPAGLTTLSGGHQWRSIDPWIPCSNRLVTLRFTTSRRAFEAPGTSEMGSTANLGSRRVYIGVRWLLPLPHVHIYMGVNQRTF